MGKECLYHYTFQDRRKRPYEAGQEMEITDTSTEEMDMRSRESIEADSSHCSVASSRSYSAIDMCFGKRSPPKSSSGIAVDGAQSLCEYTNGRHDGFPSQEEVAAQVHEVELYAYFSVLRVLYVSGPLSWDQEALLTNLRLLLHVSNDEHILELRRLCSTQAV
eukprot:Gb_05112 [translate_table: standard]